MTIPDTAAGRRRARTRPGASSLRADDSHPRPTARNPHPAQVRRWCAGGAGGSALLVVLLWIRGSGLADLGASPGSALASVGRLCGLSAGALLVAQVLAMSRLPLLERAYGRGELARLHRLSGLGFFVALVVHVVLATAGGALLASRSLFTQAWELVNGDVGMALAAMALVAFVCVVATSLRAARRRLRYESWHLLHLYAYLGIVLSIPHELWKGKDFVDSPAVRVAWLSAYAVAGMALLTYRLAAPVVRSMRAQITVTSVAQEADGVVTVHMVGRGLGRLGVQAGQFFVWRFMDGPGWSRGNPYSLSAAPRRNRVQITAREPGSGPGRLGRLGSLEPGTRVLIEGPYGRLTSQHLIGDRVVMLACGMGIAPLKALLEDLDLAPSHATLIYRARSESEVLFRDELEALASERGVELHVLLGHRRLDRPSWLPVTEDPQTSDVAALRRLVPDIRHRDVFVCGPDGWMTAVCKAAIAAGVPQAQLHRERFAW